jgi:hypothetical protein
MPEDSEVQANLGSYGYPQHERGTPPRIPWVGRQPPPQSAPSIVTVPAPRRRAWPRLTSGLVLALLGGFAAYGIALHRHALGRSGFIAAQAQLWDQRYAAPSVGVILGIALSVAVFLGLYEAIALGLERLGRSFDS